MTALPDLVCPAGSLPALRAAVDNGADAVYLGFKNDTNARNFAGLNFDPKTMAEGIRYARGKGCEVLLAINTFPQAGRVADFLEFGELTCRDALHREESCGGHFRVEHQTEDGEARRDDERFAYVAAWEYAGEGNAPILNKEPLVFENVHLSTRSYK